MTTTRRFFEPGDFPDEIYCALRDEPQCERWRAFCLALWERYAPYADPNFLSDIRRQFQQRFWEMAPCLPCLVNRTHRMCVLLRRGCPGAALRW